MGLLATLTSNWVRARVTNTTDNGFPSRVATPTEPSGLGDSAAQATASAVFDIANGLPGMSEYNRMMVKPFAAGADNVTFSVRVIAWNLTLGRDGSLSPTLKCWTPQVMAEVACTASTDVGTGSRAVASTDRFADTLSITNTTANQGVGIDLVTNAANLGAYFIVDLRGAQKVELTFTTGGSATNCNALVRGF
jgi:hypothetical protein